MQNYAQQAYVQAEQRPSGGFKAAWFFVGFLLGIGGILVAFGSTWGRPQEIKSEAIKFAIIGCIVTFVIGICSALTLGTMFYAVFEQMFRYSSYY